MPADTIMPCADKPNAAPASHLPGTRRDARMTLRYARVHGFSMLELIAAIAIMSSLAAIAIPALQQKNYNVWAGHDQVLQDLRLARMNAISKGDHFRITIIDATTWEMRRLRDPDGDGVWTPDANPVFQRTLPRGVTFTTGVGSAFEFNTRGLTIASVAATVTLTETRTSLTRVVTVFPSGQVAPIVVT